MTRKTLETTLLMLAQKRDELQHSVEFNQKYIIPPCNVDHLHRQIADIEWAITEIELLNDVRVVAREEAKVA